MPNFKKPLVALCASTIFVSVPHAFADVGFTKEDLELAKGACLVGSSFDFVTEADGSLSIKNLEGKGKLHVGNKSVDVVDLPDADKKAEFNEIRTCIKGYLKGDARPPQQTAEMSRTCSYTSGPKAGQIQYFPPSVPITPAPIGYPCQDGFGSWGVAIRDR